MSSLTRKTIIIRSEDRKPGFWYFCKRDAKNPKRTKYFLKETPKSLNAQTLLLADMVKVSFAGYGKTRRSPILICSSLGEYYYLNDVTLFNLLKLN
jgi:hypothetical protein